MEIHAIRVLVFASLWTASVCNVALFRELSRLPDLTGYQATAISVAMALLIASVTMGTLSLLAWRWTLKPAITIFWVSAAFGAYFMMAYGVVIDKHMIINTLQTDFRETRDLLSWRLFATVMVLAVLPSLWLWRQALRRDSMARTIGLNALTFATSCALLALVVMVFFQSIASVMRNYPHVRYLINPLNSFYALGSLVAKPLNTQESRSLPLGTDAALGASYTAQAKPPLLLLVVGETARGVNFGINGYARATTPKLANESIVSQRNAWSCGTSTAASVPCMFSNLGRANYDADTAGKEGLLDVLKRAGLAVLWIDNQSGCKGVCDRVPNVSTSNLDIPVLCPKGECFDEVMLLGLDERIAALPEASRRKGVVVVMHQMGGHGPAYYQRSPAAFKKFRPECTSNALQACDNQALVNAYDNSVVYTDHLLSSNIQWLKKREKDSSTAMIYVADHGESLGENNLYLHGMPYNIAPDVQKHIPWITWLSASFEQRTSITTACLRRNEAALVTHDSYFHSVLGMMNVQTSVYRPALDLYAGCAIPAPATANPALIAKNG